MKMKKILALTCATAMVFGLAACGSAAADTTETDTTAADTTAADTTGAATEETADLSGTISMAGSTSMEKLANAVAAVSYTHLREADLVCSLQKWPNLRYLLGENTVSLTSRSATAVSYTHLDVYKRQMLIFMLAGIVSGS